MLLKDADRWDDALSVADATLSPKVEQLRKQRMNWLISTGQQERAGQVRP